MYQVNKININTIKFEYKQMKIKIHLEQIQINIVYVHA